MRLPRDLSGEKVARLLGGRYGYRVSRSRGSHMTVTLTKREGKRHSVTVPKHREVLWHAGRHRDRHGGVPWRVKEQGP